MEYWGLEAIAQVLGFKAPQTVYRFIREWNFPAFQRPRPGQWAIPNRVQWYTDDDLIHGWKLTLAGIKAQELRRTHSQRKYRTPKGLQGASVCLETPVEPQDSVAPVDNSVPDQPISSGNQK